jgi:hypothetical protein
MTVKTKTTAKLRIISGGQTGADRAALDWATTHRFPRGGWCPKGRLAEDGVIDPKYRLKETPSASYAERTEWNIRDADGTVLFSMREQLAGGSLLTANLARRNRKPFLHLVHGTDPAENVKRLRTFITRYKIQILNVSGPRASEEPHVRQFVQQTLEQALAGPVNSTLVASPKPAVRPGPVTGKSPTPKRPTAARR